MIGEQFLTPRLTGRRFEGGVVPLHVLAEFAVLEQMILDTAKWKFRSRNPNRKRITRGFDEGISLKLTGLGEGSAKPVISLFCAASALFSSGTKAYFEEARTAIVDSIREAELDRPISALPPDILGYFARFGRSLEPGEAMEFASGTVETPARLTQESRHRLVIASKVKEYIGDIVLHGTVTGMDAKEAKFNLQRLDGTRIEKISYGELHLEPLLEAFNAFADNQKLQVRVHATGRFNRERKLLGIDAVDQVVAIDALDVRARVEELKLLRTGWLDGRGRIPPAASLDWLVDQFEGQYPDDLRLPFLFPTESGRILAEWSLGSWALSLEIEPAQQRAEWHALNLETDDEAESTVDLSRAESWTWLAEEIRSRGGVAE